MAQKYVYLFSEGNGSMRELLGGKGANLAEMVNLGMPVPQGFTVTTEACTQYYNDGRSVNPSIEAGWSSTIAVLLVLGGVIIALIGVVGEYIGRIFDEVKNRPNFIVRDMAGWAAARSSPRLHYWLWNHRLFGPMLQDWSQGGRVSRKAKWSASIVMALCACILLISGAPLWVKITANACMACVLTWLWFRPEPSADTQAPKISGN